MASILLYHLNGGAKVFDGGRKWSYFRRLVDSAENAVGRVRVLPALELEPGSEPELARMTAPVARMY